MATMILGLQLSQLAVAYSLASILAVVILVLSLRVEFKKSQHYVFLAFMGWVTFYFVDHFLAELQTTPQAFISTVRWSEVLAPAPVLLALLYHFVLLFRSPAGVRGWWRYSLVAVYGWAVANVGLAAWNNSLFLDSVDSTNIGWVHGSGTLGPYLDPFGLQWISIAIGALTLAALVDGYRSRLSPIIRRQTLYLTSGALLYLVALASPGVLRLLAAGILQPLLEGAGTAFLLVGATASGFYPVAPKSSGDEIAAGDATSDLGLTAGRSYLGLDKEPSFNAFAGLVRDGWSGFCLSTIPPDEIRQRYGLEETPIKWLANSRSENAIDPGDLAGISKSISGFLMQAERAAILLDGLDYLISSNGVRPTMGFINKLSQINAFKAGILLISSPGEEAGASASVLEVFSDVPQIQARLTGAGVVEVGEELQLRVDLFNVGKKTSRIDRIEDLVPERLSIVHEPKEYKFKGSTLGLRGKKLQPFQLESIVIVVKGREAGDEVLRPRVIYTDDNGTEYFRSIEPVTIRVVQPPGMDLESDQARSALAFLVQAFNKDYMLDKRPVEESGWRSLVQVAQATDVSKSALYGSGGTKYGQPIFELLSRGLIEERVFTGHRGRGGEATMLRVSYGREPVKRYVDRVILRPS